MNTNNTHISASDVMDMFLDLKKFLEQNMVMRFEFNEFKMDINVRFDDVYQRFDDVYQRFDDIDRKFEAVDKRFDLIDQRFEDSNSKIGSFHYQIMDYIDRRFIEERAHHKQFHTELIDVLKNTKVIGPKDAARLHHFNPHFTPQAENAQNA